VPRGGAGTLAVIGDLKQMSPRWLLGTSMLGYGCTLTVGIGVPIPILSEEILSYTTVTDDQILVRASPIDGSEVATVIGLGRIIDMNETSMQMDFNNKLAGQTLTFEITVLNFISY
jgi:uncharacterized protein (DUF39 family)